MNIGIVGWGVVGGAIASGFEMLGHSVCIHDIKLNTSIEDVLETTIVFICVPTPSDSSGRCDTSYVFSVVNDLKTYNYSGIIALKSTSEPGTTQSLIDKYNDNNICVVPEFLRERMALQDFVANHKLLAVGCCSDKAWQTVCNAHGWLPENTVRMLPTEAEILKYYSNTFNALRVVFANIMYELSDNFNCDYNKILEAFLLRETATADYLECSPELRGYAGACLPKDVLALRSLCEQLNLPYNLFATIHDDNKKIIT